MSLRSRLLIDGSLPLAPAIPGWHSQIGQDECLVEHIFKRRRGLYYIDLAANDARHLSNTYVLDRNYSWSGLCVEANGRYLSGLVNDRSCAVARVVVSNISGVERRFRFTGENGGLFMNWMKELTDHQRRTVKTITTVGIAELLAHANVPAQIDYVSLDLEGAEEEVLRAWPFEAHAFDVLTIERPTVGVHKLLTSRGYCVKLSFDNEIGDVLYVRRANRKLANAVSRGCRRRPFTETVAAHVRFPDDFCTRADSWLDPYWRFSFVKRKWVQEPGSKAVLNRTYRAFVHE